jgi:hypothetical protein
MIEKALRRSGQESHMEVELEPAIGMQERRQQPLADETGAARQEDPAAAQGRPQPRQAAGGFIQFWSGRDHGCAELWTPQASWCWWVERHKQAAHEPHGRSADFQSAVSRISNPLALAQQPRLGGRSGSLPSGTRRYSRLEICATGWRWFRADEQGRQVEGASHELRTRWRFSAVSKRCRAALATALQNAHGPCFGSSSGHEGQAAPMPTRLRQNCKTRSPIRYSQASVRTWASGTPR